MPVADSKSPRFVIYVHIKINWCSAWCCYCYCDAYFKIGVDAGKGVLFQLQIQVVGGISSG